MGLRVKAVNTLLWQTGPIYKKSNYVGYLNIQGTIVLVKKAVNI